MSVPDLFTDPNEPEVVLEYVRVAVERGFDRVAGDELVYSGEGLAVGDRVLVPLGRAKAPVRGVVVEIDADPGPVNPSKIRAVVERMEPSIPEDLVKLGQWLAGYYACPAGMVFASMLPAAVRQGPPATARRQVAPTELAEIEGKLSPAAKKVFECVTSATPGTFPIEAAGLARLAGVKSTSAIRTLVDRGVLRYVDPWEPLATATRSSSASASPTALTLSDEQSAALDTISRDEGHFATHLLFGITGSGKTEVYLRLVERCLARGQSAIVLVPEIALTPQTSRRFAERFPLGTVAVMHSGLPASARARAWGRAAAGEVRVVVGARSAVFAPLPNVGLIVVDEEHDSSYKQASQPRYHARDVAVKRAHQTGCPVVLGSATPAIETWSNAKQGRSTVSKLVTRPTGASLPHVEIVDMARERPERIGGEVGSIGPTLDAAIRKAWDQGHQIVLLLNRRGFASSMVCSSRACGWSLTCDACDAAMVLHAPRGGRLRFTRCHHCLAERKVPELCPDCGRAVIRVGAGTQRIEVELAERYAGIGLDLDENAIRVDGDTMSRAADYAEAMSRFASGEARLMLGTQMIAKGIDVPNVSLVGVLSADTALWMPDFRAQERTYQLVSQVAGRAGRGDIPGLVVVQTFAPEDPAIVLASRHAYERFAAMDLQARASGGLPPHRRMARVITRDEDRGKAERRAEDIAALARDAVSGKSGSGEVSVEGPAPCAMARVADRFRFAVEIFAHRAVDVQKIIAALRTHGIHSGADTEIDVDPVDLM